MLAIPVVLSLDFTPRPPCGGRLKSLGKGGRHLGISTHAPRVGGDSEGRGLKYKENEVQNVDLQVAPHTGGVG